VPLWVFSLVSFQGRYRRIRVEAVHKFSIEIIVEEGLLGGLKKYDETIVPWQVELPSQVNAKDSFLKSIKPNSKEYKVLRADKGWLPFRESMEMTAMSHKLLTMIIPPFEINPNTGELVIDPANGKLIPYEPDDQGLDELQCTWFFKVLVDVCQTPVAKKIVNQNRNTMDTRQVWHELCEHYQNSISSKMRSQELLRWAHTAQLANSNHRGTSLRRVLSRRKFTKCFRYSKTVHIF